MGRIFKSRFFLVSLFFTILINYAVFGAEADLTKMHPRFVSLVTESNPSHMLLKQNSNSDISLSSNPEKAKIGVLIRTTNSQILDEVEIAYNSVYPEFVTAKVSIDELKRLSNLKEVEYLDAPSISYPATNVSLPQNGTALLHNGALNNTAYKGKDVLILIFDTGIDWNHSDFKDPQDPTKSRILYIWDQTLSAQMGESSPSGFNYGVEYTKSDIDDEIDGSPNGDVREEDSNGHGSHVAGTAAGSGVKFSGMAPEADIIVVKGGNGSFSEDNIIDALTYAEQKATALGKPIIVNFSLGGQDGPHDGSRAYEIAIDNFSSKPGRVVVVSAGNDGADEIHTSGSIVSGGNVTLQMTVPSFTAESGANNDDFSFNLWFDGNATVTAKVTSPNGVVYERTSGAGTASDDSDGKIYLENLTVSGSKRTVGFQVYDAILGNTPAEGVWTLELIGVSNAIVYDGWLSDNMIGEPASRVTLQNGDNDKSVSMPGTANKSLTVGAYVTKITWPSVSGGQFSYTDDDEPGDIAIFSSQGPTRDGRLKPEISAPGKGIVAALSNQLEDSEDAVWINPDNIHFLSQGTSMSAPHVAGASALLLSNNPSLMVDEIKSLLGNTALSDDNTQSTPNNTWGYGKMDVLQAVAKQTTMDSVVTKEVVNYVLTTEGPYYQFTIAEKFAVRYTAPSSGKISGAFLMTLINHPDVNPIITGDGSLLVSIHQDSNGYPGVQYGSTVAHSLDLLDPGTDNYINLLDANATVQSGENYHIVLALSDAGDSIKIKFDNGKRDYAENYSEIYLYSQWQKLGDIFSSAYNMQLKSENIKIEYVNALDEDPGKIARTFSLDQNYPNPFNPSTTIQFNLTRQGPVNLSIFDVLGREIAILSDDVKLAGSHEIVWDGKNRNGNQVPTGIYFYRLKTNEGVLSKKMLLVK